MTEKEGSPLSLAIPGFALLIALVGTAVWRTRALVSERPEMAANVTDHTPHIQKLPARLWQDPLGAIKPQEEKKQSTTAIDLRTCWNDARKKSNGDPTKVLLLFAILPSASYAEDTEVRLRSRYAVVSALSVAGFRPTDEEHLGAVRLAQPSAENPSLSWILPFEWFNKRVFDHQPISQVQSHTDSVLLVWVPDNLFATENSAVPHLSHLVRSFKQAAPSLLNSHIDTSILGPRGSSMLRGMLAQFRDPYDRSRSEEIPISGDSLRDVRMYSWSATAMDDLLAPGIAYDSNGKLKPASNQSKPRDGIAEELKRNYGLNFKNTIATDDQFSEELIDELRLRQVDLTDSTQHVALISEWDTFYGRNIPVAFDITLRNHIEGKKRPIPEIVAEFRIQKRPEGTWTGLSLNKNLHSFSYLRGLDGKLPGDKREVKELETTRVRSEVKDIVRLNERAMNRAEGQNQLDYVPRLGDQLERLQKHLQKNGSTLKAIGVVGSDFYDKLLIMQGLRDRFPSAVFFTTDLDARYLQPEFLKWTRNLVVVSGFDLTLHPQWQRDISPFRSGYQTSLYFSALCALNVFPELPPEAPPPRRFEIGRFHAVDLSVSGPGQIHPESWRLVPGFQSWLIVIAIVWLTCVIILFAFPWLRWRYLPAKRIQRIKDSLQVSPEDIIPIHDRDGNSAILSQEQRCKEAEDINTQLIKLGKRLERLPKGARARPIARKAEQNADRFSGWMIGFWASKQRKELSALTAARDQHDEQHSSLIRSAEARTVFRMRELRMHVLELLGVVIGISVFVYCAVQSHANPEGEPIALWEGISIWPSECFRLAALALSLFFIGRTLHSLEKNRLDICSEFGFEDTSFARTNETKPEVAAASANGKDLWNQYQNEGRLRWRLIYPAILTVLYFLCGSSLVLLFDQSPFVPARGALAWWTDKVVLFSSVFASIFLTFLVVHATRLCRTLVHGIEAPTYWPIDCLRRFAVKNMGAAHEDLGPWIDMQLVTRVTTVVSQLVYFPFIVLGVMVIARSRYFDAWDWPLALILIMSINALWAFSSVFLLRNTARRAKDTSVATLRKLRIQAKMSHQKERLTLIDEMLADIEKMQEGALSPAMSNPALKALLFPLTGGGLALLLEFLTAR